MVDLSGFAVALPVFSFLLVFVVMFAVLKKTEVLGSHNWLLLFVSFLIAIIFITIGSVRQYVETITPWFAVLIVSLLFILMLIGFIGIKMDKGIGKGVGVAALLVLVAIFLVSGVVVFGSVIWPYLPGGAPEPGPGSDFVNWLYSGPVAGAILLLVLAGVVSWVLTRK